MLHGKKCDTQPPPPLVTADLFALFLHLVTAFSPQTHSQCQKVSSSKNFERAFSLFNTQANFNFDQNFAAPKENNLARASIQLILAKQ